MSPSWSLPLRSLFSRAPRSEVPIPDHANVRYGPHERNIFDVWLAESDRRTPLDIYFHGGGFGRGDKRSINLRLFEQLRAGGVSVAAVNYRLSGTAPYPAQMHDCARALQFIRLNAADYNLDPTRIGATGGSAGAGISQWLAFDHDLADPHNPDPVLRQSTRLAAVVPYNAQASYDPRFIKRLMNSDQVEETLIPFFGTAPVVLSTLPAGLRRLVQRPRGWQTRPPDGSGCRR